MSHVRKLGSSITVSFSSDQDGFIGRECPQAECLGYFKVTPGTGVLDATTCFCPYCGHEESPDEFFTQEQIGYAKSVALHQITGALLQDLKALEFNHPPQGPFGIGLSLTVTGSPEPIRYYREKQLETEVVCDACTLRYAIFGVFAFCPDCGAHNSLQILGKNLELVEKELALAADAAPELQAWLVADALKNVISSFDAFGRQVCRVHATAATDPSKVAALSFQNLARARVRVQQLFGIDLTTAVSPDAWASACRGFQKRHLLSHTGGVIDDAYVRETGDPQAVVGRKVRVDSAEVRALVATVHQVGRMLAASLAALKPDEKTP